MNPTRNGQTSERQTMKRCQLEPAKPGKPGGDDFLDSDFVVNFHRMRPDRTTINCCAVFLCARRLGGVDQMADWISTSRLGGVDQMADWISTGRLGGVDQMADWISTGRLDLIYLPLFLKIGFFSLLCSILVVKIMILRQFSRNAETTLSLGNWVMCLSSDECLLCGNDYDDDVTYETFGTCWDCSDFSFWLGGIYEERHTGDWYTLSANYVSTGMVSIAKTPDEECVNGVVTIPEWTEQDEVLTVREFMERFFAVEPIAYGCLAE